MATAPQPDGRNRVDVKMTLTAQGCGMGTSIAIDAKQKLLTIPAISEANVDLVWYLPWNPQMISSRARNASASTERRLSNLTRYGLLVSRVFLSNRLRVACPLLRSA